MIYITCKRCGFTDDEDFFPKSFSRVKKIYFHHVCLGCIQVEKDTAKRPNRAVPKARAILYSHCQKYNRRKGTKLTLAEFARKFGWDLKQVTHDIEHAFNNWCSYCKSPYNLMGHGLADVTLDILDRDADPYYTTNTKYCCPTCNKRKGVLLPSKFAKYLVSFDRWRAFLNSGGGTLVKPQYRLLGTEGAVNRVNAQPKETDTTIGKY